MEPIQHTSPRLDALDIEKFEQLIAGELFKIIWDRVTAELKRVQETCEKGDSELEIRRAQGAVKFGRMVVNMPEMLLAEMRAGSRYTNSHPKSRGPSNP